MWASTGRSTRPHRHAVEESGGRADLRSVSPFPFPAVAPARRVNEPDPDPGGEPASSFVSLSPTRSASARNSCRRVHLGWVHDLRLECGMERRTGPEAAGWA